MRERNRKRTVSAAAVGVLCVAMLSAGVRPAAADPGDPTSPAISLPTISLPTVGDATPPEPSNTEVPPGTPELVLDSVPNETVVQPTAESPDDPEATDGDGGPDAGEYEGTLVFAVAEPIGQQPGPQSEIGAASALGGPVEEAYVLSDEVGIIEVTEEIPAEAESGDQVRVEIDEQGEVANVEVLETDAREPEVNPAKRGASLNSQHAIDLVVMTPKNAQILSSDVAELKALTEAVGKYWTTQSGGQINYYVGAVVQKAGALPNCDSDDAHVLAWQAAADALAVSGGFSWKNYLPNLKNNSSNLHKLAERTMVVLVPRGCENQLDGIAETPDHVFGIGAATYQAGLVYVNDPLADLKQTSSDGIAHEFGHTLGARHAGLLVSKPDYHYDQPSNLIKTYACNRKTEAVCNWWYHDFVDVMGISGAASSVQGSVAAGYTLRGMGLLSGPQADRLGFNLNKASIESGSRTFDISPLTANSGTRLVTVKDPTNGDIYYLEYRVKSGQDANRYEYAWNWNDEGYTPSVGIQRWSGYGVRILKVLPSSVADDGKYETTVLGYGRGAKKPPVWSTGEEFVSHSKNVRIKVNSTSASQANITVTIGTPSTVVPTVKVQLPANDIYSVAGQKIAAFKASATISNNSRPVFKVVGLPNGTYADTTSTANTVTFSGTPSEGGTY